MSSDGKSDSEVVRLVAEELAITRERVETGRLRVHVETHTHEEQVDIPLMQEHVEVERVAINRPVDAVPSTRHDGETTIIPVVEETLIIERQLMLKEELHVRRVRKTERHQESVVLRHQTAVITRTSAGTPGKDPQGG